ncbi:hypothetical protein NPIL_583831, partial [Nephila pilipes]
MLLFQIASCQKDGDCKNGGICGKDKVCVCKAGSSGDLCEIVDGCDKLECVPEISNCVLNPTNKAGMCKCREEMKLYVNHKCI